MQAAVKESARCIMKDSRLVPGILKTPRAMLNSASGPDGKNMQGKVAAAIQVQFSVAPLADNSVFNNNKSIQTDSTN